MTIRTPILALSALLPLPLLAAPAAELTPTEHVDALHAHWVAAAQILDSVTDKTSADAAAAALAPIREALPAHFRAIGMPHPSPELQKVLKEEEARLTPAALMVAWGKLQNRSQSNYYASELLSEELKQLARGMRALVRLDYDLLGAVQAYEEQAGAALHELVSLLASVQDKASADAAAARVAELVLRVNDPALLQRSKQSRGLSLKRIYKARLGMPLGRDIEQLWQEAGRLAKSTPPFFGSEALVAAMEQWP